MRGSLLLFSVLLSPLVANAGWQDAKQPATQPKANTEARPGSGWADRVHRLDNGFELLIEPVKGSKVMGLFFFVKSGWDRDPDGKTGLAHYVEHMVMTAGTPGRKGGWEYGDWVRRRKHGANAMTRAGWTLYFSIGSRDECSSDARWFQEVLAGKAEFLPAQMERERERMQGEVKNMTLYRPGGILQWRARRLLLEGADARTGIGVPDEVAALDLESIRKHVALTHHAGNVLCVAVGRVHAERDLPFYKDLFGSLEARVMPALSEPKLGKAPDAVTEHPNVGAVFGTLSFRAPAPTSKEFPAWLMTATWVMQRAMAERKPRGQQIQGMFFPAQYAYLEGPEVFNLNLRGVEGQSMEVVRKDLEDWVARKQARKMGWAYLKSSQTTLRLFYPPHPLQPADLAAYAGAPRSLYRLGLSRGVSILSGIGPDMPSRLAKVGTADMKAMLKARFGGEHREFLGLLPSGTQKK